MVKKVHVAQKWETHTVYCSNTSICPLILNSSKGFHGDDCSSPVNGCVSNPCDPEGALRCEDLKTTYKCACRHGHTGRHCENPISHCVDHLCHRGSKCTDLPGGFKCDCLPGKARHLAGLPCRPKHPEKGLRLNGPL